MKMENLNLFQTQVLSKDLPFIDIKLINDNEVDERVNFIIKCENQEQADMIKELLKLSGRKNGTSAEILLKRWHERL